MSHSPRDPDAVRQALTENQNEPEGPARNARAERLVSDAEETGDGPLLVDALFNLIAAYQYSSERDKAFVPFARVLRTWDEHPGNFGEDAVQRLHWIFKWVSSGMLDQPHIPLASIENWLGEMEHRYRLAGHSERAVRQGEFRIARHIGDTARATRAYAAWQAADRDRMSDCHACELHGQGSWQVHLGQDAKALDTWRPVLAGELTCAHEPHAVLASSLLPLVRLGRHDEARAHHLRGYRMVRAMESMRSAVAEHVEFCALTGNEARGLEILAQHPAYFTDQGDPDSLTDHLAVTALLMRRLDELGHGDRSVPGPAGRSWTARELHGHARREALALARRFDDRNGTDAVGREVTLRLDRAPLLDRLPLGVRTDRPVIRTKPEPAPVPAAVTVTTGEDVTALVAEARLLTRAQHPTSRAAWAAVGRAAERTGTALESLARAEVTDHAALDAFDDPDTAVPLFRTAAEQYEAAGEPGEAAACRARAAYAAAVAGRTAEGAAGIDAACAELYALHTQGRATARQTTGALLGRARTSLMTLHQAPDPAAAAAALDTEVREVLAFAEAHRDEDRMTARIADATSLLGRLAGGRGDTKTAAALFARAAELHHEAGLPWFAVEAEAVLTELSLDAGDPEAAEEAARAALEHGAGELEPAGTAHLHILLAEALAATGQDAEAADHALEGAHWADQAGQSENLGGWARLVLGGAFRRLGRAAEAASVLETALPDLLRDHHEGRVVQARWWLGECLSELGEPRESAEQFLLAAETAKGWDDQQDHAHLANLAADSLSSAQLDDQAVQAYARAEELWRQLNRPPAVVRTLRARAWIALRDGQGGLPAARRAMTAAAHEAGTALAAATDEQQARHLRSELAGTYRQTAELLIRACPGEPGDEDTDGTARAAYLEALSYAEQAITTFGPGDDRTAAQLMAAWLEADLGLRGKAADRARAVIAEYAGETGDIAGRRRAEAESVIEYSAG